MESQLKPVAFPPGVMPRLLNVKESRHRRWREDIDPIADRKTYSRRDIFAHFVLRYFVITKETKSRKLFACDWSEVFLQCNRQTFANLRKCRVIINSKEGTAKVVPKEAGFDIDNPYLEWACLDRVYKEYISMITNDFSSSTSQSALTSFAQYSQGN